MSTTSDAKDRVDETRQQLEDTLDAIEQKLNVPKRLGELTKKAESAYRGNPVPFIVGGAAAAILVAGTIVWAVVSGDD